MSSFQPDPQKQFKLSKKKSSSLKNLSFFGKTRKSSQSSLSESLKNDTQDLSQASRYWISNLNTNNNGSSSLSLSNQSSLNRETRDESDYRTFLRNIRPPIRPPSSSDDDSDLDEGDEDHLSTNTWAEANGSSLESNNPENPNMEVLMEGVTCGNPEEALANLGSLRSTHAILKITVTVLKITKCIRVDINESIWAVKHRIIHSFSQKPPYSFNYGLFSQTAGRFLLDHKQMKEYLRPGTIESYEFRYKRRVFHVTNRKDSMKLVKMQTAAKQREFLKHVNLKNTDKILSLIHKGLDPNFHDENGEETPLTILSTLNNSSMTFEPNLEKKLKSSFRRSQLRKSRSSLHLESRPVGPVILALVGAGGAHIDFRNKQGHTPVHVAARSGHAAALKNLLDLGASPDVLDLRDLTPLYHCCIMDKGTGEECVRMLLDRGARLDCVDSQKWNILHQVCRYGHLDHLSILLNKIEDLDEESKSNFLNLQNATGNSPLHVCALYNKEFCLITLLDHGADRNIRNFSNQDPCQVAIMAGNTNLAHLIKDYSKDSDKGHVMLRERIEVPQSLRVTSNSKKEDVTSSNRRHTLSAALFTKKKKNLRKDSGFTDEDFPSIPSMSRTELDLKEAKTQKYDTQLPADSVLPAEPIFVCQPQIKDKKDKDTSDQSSYVVIKDFEANKSDQLTVRTGQLVHIEQRKDISENCSLSDFTLVSIGPSSGLVPSSCLQSVKLRNPSREISEAEQKEDQNLISAEMESMLLKSSQAFNDNLRPTDDPQIFHRCKDAEILKGSNGYGFVLRGYKDVDQKDTFKPTPSKPALQFLESVQPFGAAHKSGLEAYDYVMKISSKDVRFMGHHQIVELIKKVTGPLKISVISVVKKENIASSLSLSTPIINRLSSSFASLNNHSHARAGSVVSAITQLDNVIAEEEMSSNPETSVNEKNSLQFHDSRSRVSNSHQKTNSLTRRLKKVPIPILPTQASDPKQDQDSFTPVRKISFTSNKSPDKIPSFKDELATKILKPSENRKKLPPAPPRRMDSLLGSPTDPKSSVINKSSPTSEEGSLASTSEKMKKTHEMKDEDASKEVQSPLEIALQAKKASLSQAESAIDCSNLIKPSKIKSQMQNSSHPKPPKNDPFKLPPPPTKNINTELLNHPRFEEHRDLPPPPENLKSPFSSSSNLDLPPPPPDYGVSQLTLKNGGVETASNTDSGIDDRALPPNLLFNAPSNVETGSVVSSEDGSDIGVSMAFDKPDVGRAKLAYMDLIRKQHSNHKMSPPKKLPADPDFMINKPSESWSVNEVSSWLRHLGLEMYIPSFVENEIDGSHLPDLGKEELIELGVKRMGHRMTIEKSLKKIPK